MVRTHKVFRKADFSGTGIHSGEHCVLTVSPSVDTGIFFDLDGGIFPIGAAECDGTARGTRLVFPGGEEILTVEHLLGTLAGLGIWNAVISVEGPEIPVLDGSGAVFADALSGSICSGPDITPVDITREIAFGDPSRGGFIAAVPSDSFDITCVIRYEATGVGCQVFEGTITSEKFIEEIAPARTFVLSSEIEGIMKRGLGKGGAIDNVLVISDDTPPLKESLRVPDEPVRHKVLDLIGDLATLGAPVRGRIVAYRAGHDMHLELARRIRRSNAGR